MTAKRNQNTDRKTTAFVLQLTGRARTDALNTVPNWLQHRALTAELDKALVSRATIEELKLIRGAVYEHIRHLRIEHGLTVAKTGNVFRITG